jgi:hypothetical protein
MARELDLIQNFRPDDFTRVYLPQTVMAEMQIRNMQQRATLRPAVTSTVDIPSEPAAIPAAAFIAGGRIISNRGETYA